MFAIFKSGKQASEQVSTMAIASELLKKHRANEPKAKLEIKARVIKTDQAGREKKTAKGKNSYQWVSMDEYNKILSQAESGDLFNENT